MRSYPHPPLFQRFPEPARLAFDAVWPAGPAAPALELVGSEEVEPGNSACSGPVTFDCLQGEITTTVYE